MFPNMFICEGRLIKGGLFFNSASCSPHASSISVAVLRSHWSKSDPVADIRSTFLPLLEYKK